MQTIDLSQFLNIDGLTVESAFSFLQITLSLSVTLLMALFIFYIYKKTYNGVLYSKNFNLTLIMTALTVDAIMMGIGGNLILSLGLVGALSIIRFRTAVKDPKDTAFLFWAITIGVVNGVAYYELSVMASLFMAGVLLFLSRKGGYEPSYILILKYRHGAYKNIEPQIQKYFKRYFVCSDSQKEDIVEKVIEIKVDSKTQGEALEKIRSIEGVENCVLLASNGEFAE